MVENTLCSLIERIVILLGGFSAIVSAQPWRYLIALAMSSVMSPFPIFLHENVRTINHACPAGSVK